MALIELKSVALSHGGPPVLDGVDLRVHAGERISLVGRNGEGKSTLLRVLAGTVRPDAGEIVRQGGLRIGWLPQEVPAEVSGTVDAVVRAGLAAALGAERAREEGHLVAQALTRGGLDGEADFATLSQGNRRRALLARAMVAEPDLLLLDEPTNHLDIDAIAWLEGELQRFGGTLVFVTHDRAFLRGLADRIVELDRGRLRDWSCDYTTFVARRDEALRVEQEQWAAFDRKLAQEEVWIRQGVRERRTRNEGRVRELKRMREERRERREQAGAARIGLQEAGRSGRLVARVRDLEFGWGATSLVKDFSTLIQRGDRVGILGPNGAGKTTLLRLLLGELAPRRGTVERGTNLQVAYFDQQRAQLDETRTVMENVTDGRETIPFGGRTVHAITYLKNFLFTPDRARSPITHLSGGERNRLLLARLFTQPANLLVLDEPTNDLDIETVELLEELVGEFDGTLLLVSHDREFLDNVTTSTLVLEGEGRVAETVGGYADWARASRAAARERAREEAAANPRTDRRETPPAPGGQSAAAPKKLTWKESRELEELPDRIEALETEQSALHARLADPAFYQGPGAEIAAVRSRLESLSDQLTSLYDRWSELSERSG
ncbi:ATP-binding cassette domain-containing protein [bacterium]|nr:ATP-binding cassette domain-containing protein [bacterium]